MKSGMGLLLLCIHLTSSLKLQLEAESVDRSHARFRKENFQLQSPTDASVKLTNFRDNFYYGQIQIGSSHKSGSNNENGFKKQTFTVLMDTGSSTLWVPTKYGDETVTKAKLNTYDRKSSATYKPVKGYEDSTFEQVYGTGTIYGIYASDQVQIADVTIEGQVFAEVIYRGNFSTGANKFDGILGLGIPYKDPDFYMLSVIPNLIEKKLMKEPLISFYFNRKTTDNIGGEVTFGSIDTTKYKGEMLYVPLTDNADYWAIDIEGIIVNGIDTLTRKMPALMDTGTTLIIGPSEVVNKIYSIILETGVTVGQDFTYKCKDAGKLPVITISFQGKKFDLKGEDYTYKFKKNHEYECRVGVAGADKLEWWIFGQTFLGNFYSVFHYEKKQIGFAELA